MKKIRTRLLLVTFLATIGLAAAAQGSNIPRWKIADLQRYMDTTSAPAVINFWATFCRPCIAEIPYFQELAKKYSSQGVRLLLVSLDLPEDYKRLPAFTAKRRITAPVVFLDESNADLFCPRVDSSWSGALPASLFLNRGKSYRHFSEDSFFREKLEAEIRKMLQ